MIPPDLKDVAVAVVVGLIALLIGVSVLVIGGVPQTAMTVNQEQQTATSSDASRSTKGWGKRFVVRDRVFSERGVLGYSFIEDRATGECYVLLDAGTQRALANAPREACD